MRKTALITGACGFLGKHTARYFSDQGYTITGIGHGTWSRAEWEGWGIEQWHCCDVTLNSLITYSNRPDIIVHCAGSGSVGFSLTNPYFDYKRTAETTLDILEFIRLHTPNTRLVYPSSAGVYGFVECIPISEDHQRCPASPYGYHKKISEDLCISYAEHFGVSASIVRFFSIYGPELRKQLLWDACNKLMHDDTIFSGTGDEIRDWIHVEDAVRLIHTAANNCTTPCTIINGGTGIGTKISDILNQVFNALGRSDKPEFSGKSRGGDPDCYIADITRAKALPWQPGIHWRQGIRDYVEWHKKCVK